MKVITLLFAVAGLSSCVPKPWMVGSVNDQIKARPVGYGYKSPAKKTEAGPCCGNAQSGGKILNPVNHTSSNPLR